MHNGFSFFVISCIVVVYSSAASSQVIRLQNPGFEGEPRDATIPRAWHICKEGSTPDILPGAWGVYTEADEGTTYVGLITRSNGTWENIGQRLPVVLQEKKCYTFSLSLAHSDTYAGYNGNIRLRIWGGAQKCGKDQLLVQTESVDHKSWQRYTFKFTPNKNIRYLILEAYEITGSEIMQGNILIDNISVITRCTGA